jgi:hypothetical protein
VTTINILSFFSHICSLGLNQENLRRTSYLKQVTTRYAILGSFYSLDLEYLPPINTFLNTSTMTQTHLINFNEIYLVKTLVSILTLSLIGIVWFVSRRLGSALLFSLVTSILIIFFVFAARHL